VDSVASWILKIVLWIAVMTVVTGWFGRTRLKKKKSSDQANILRFPSSVLLLGLVGMAIFGGTAILTNVYSNGTETWWTTVGFTAFASLGLVLVFGYLMAKHELSSLGISYSSLSGRRRYLRWSDLHSVRYAPFMGWFRLESKSGEVARISAMLVGLPYFARLVLKHAPANTIDDEALPVLEETAEGNLPPIW
jgi:hypothetical protein